MFLSAVLNVSHVDGAGDIDSDVVIFDPRFPLVPCFCWLRMSSGDNYPYRGGLAALKKDVRTSQNQDAYQRDSQQQVRILIILKRLI